MNKFTPSMFESIKSALQKNSQSTSYKDILKMTPGNNYTVRLLPNVKDPSKTFFHYYSVGWTSFATGQYISYISPSTFGERDPVLEARYRIIRNESSSEELKKKAESILRSEKWLVNAYVVKDPTNSENDGKNTIIRYGKQLHKIIVDAIEGEGSEDFGSRIFDLSPNGCNLLIKVEKQGDYPTYVSSKFSMPKAIEGMDDPKTEAIYKSTMDLTTVLPVKSYEEIVQLLDEHFYCKDENSQSNTDSAINNVKTNSDFSVDTAVTAKINNQGVIDEGTVEELLKGLDEI